MEIIGVCNILDINYWVDRYSVDRSMDILWMEEILHQLVYGLSHCNPIIYSVL